MTNDNENNDGNAVAKPSILPIQLTTSQVRPVAYRILSKKHGLNLKSTGLDVLAKFLGHNYGADWRGSKAEKFLDQIAKLWKEQDRGLFIEGDTLALVLKEAVSIESISSQSSSKGTGTTTSASSSDKKKAQFDWKDYFKVVNVQDRPVFKYNSTRKHFEPSEGDSAKAHLISGAKNRAAIFTTRYHILYDRLLRDETFQPSSFGNTSINSITMIKNMLGRNDQEFVLMGFINKGADGEWYLQDKSGMAQLDITTRALPSELSYYTPGCFVVCTGIYHNSIFVVDNIGPPPAEKREASRQAFGYIDFLGVHSTLNVTAPGSKTSRIERIDKNFEQHLRQAEQNLNHKIVVLGCNIHLDQLRVIDALRNVFSELEEEPPLAIIFPGSFSSLPFQPTGHSQLYKESFDFLASLMEEFPNICAKSKLIFIPGDNDPWAATFTGGAAPAWPQAPIPPVFTSRLKRVCKDVVWASNPSTMAYLSQEILMVRDNYGARLRRNSIVFPHEQHEVEDQEQAQQEQNQEPIDVDKDSNDEDEDEDEDDDVASNRRAIAQMVVDSRPTTALPSKITPDVAEARKVVRTILDQGHLSPFSLQTRPIYWQYDQQLSLSPLPSMMLMIDATTPQFRVTYEGCYVINPGVLIERNVANWLEYDAARGVATEKIVYI